MFGLFIQLLNLNFSSLIAMLKDLIVFVRLYKFR
uniref:Uncharacterized protein n=1 Tax=Rhizophora mucronata TaxID=61149 RepID=A0A2P2NG81_RHIMU